tara:strand:+ start:922 stop:1800 length:879 start_codon:yes stop_codon:yes gene_type:complete
MDSSIIFSSGSSEANTFYKEFGYIHYRSNSSLFISKINKCFAYYSKPQTKESNNVAFRNKDGKPRHFIDVFRDLSSETLNIYSSKVIKALIEKNVPKNNRFIFTHSKMSFKQVDSNGGWYPHQDNGYKSEGDIREGFAIFICLEDMSEANGCIQLFPGSHKLGLLPHSRFIEDEKTGDNQFFIKDIPKNIEPKSMIAKKGDIIIFSSNTIHQSLSTTNSSKRLSLIAEIESFDSLKLDDYGKIPIFSIGSIKLIEKLMLLIKILYNPYFYWRIIKKNRKLALIVRKLKYKFN